MKFSARFKAFLGPVPKWPPVNAGAIGWAESVRKMAIRRQIPVAPALSYTRASCHTKWRPELLAAP